MSYFVKCLKNYATFSGRARRREYWFFSLFVAIISVVTYLIDYTAGLSFTIGKTDFGIIQTIVGLFFLIPSIAVTVRRLHDTDRSGVWYFMVLIPLIGSIWLFVLTVLNGTSGDNKYGSDPKLEEVK